MPINILMPALSPTMEKGNLAKWLKKEGDAVKSGDVIAEIETDKATMEVEAVDDGTIAKILVPEGTADVPVNDVIAVLAGEGEDVNAAASAASTASQASSFETQAAPAPQDEGRRSAASASSSSAAAVSTGAPHPEEGAKAPASKGEAKNQDSGRVFATPLARRVAEQSGITISGINGSGPHGRVVLRDVENAQSGGGPRVASRREGERVFASPLARKLAKDKSIDLSAISGSGPNGRIIARDIEGAKAGTGVKPAAMPAAKTPAAPAAPAPQGFSDEQVRAFYPEGTYDIVKHDGMRRIIAQRLVQAKSTIPHFYLSLDCDIGKLLAARQEINAAAPKKDDGKPAYKISVNDFIIKAMAVALVHVPEANVTWTEAAMLKHHGVDVGVAVAIPGGLITPVIRNAHSKPVSQISEEMKDYAARAKARRLKPEEYQGGTTAVSNLGMFGIKNFSAVINPPQSTILAVGVGEDRAVVKSGKIEVAKMMSVTLSCDHRAVDGALGAQLLSAFKDIIEKPVMMVA